MRETPTGSQPTTEEETKQTWAKKRRGALPGKMKRDEGRGCGGRPTKADHVIVVVVSDSSR